jgi:hypothetical protein
VSFHRARPELLRSGSTKHGGDKLVITVYWLLQACSAQSGCALLALQEQLYSAPAGGTASPSNTVYLNAEVNTATSILRAEPSGGL